MKELVPKIQQLAKDTAEQIKAQGAPAPKKTPGLKLQAVGLAKR